jgi:6-phosphogluconolactonase
VSGPAVEALRAAEPVDHVPSSFAALLQERFEHRPGGRFTLLVSGGQTAAECYDRAAERSQLDWSLVEVYVGDERVVPPDDDASNQLLVRTHLIEPLGGVGSFTPMPTEGDPERCADDYDVVLRRLLEGPGIDLIHLGLGPDGHTASLFPLADSLTERDRLCVATADPSGRNPLLRLSVTYPLIESARTAVFTVSGADRHEAVERIRADEDLPAARVATADTRWLLDVEAAHGGSGL